MLDPSIQNLVIVNRGGLVFGTERKTGRIWYSFDEGRNWEKINEDTDKFEELFPLEYPNDLVIGSINFNKPKNMYSFFEFNFNQAISSFYLMTERTCQSDDFETWHVPRYFGNCFQGQEIFYLKKKPSTICFDNRTEVLPTSKSCPCSLEDFQWYIITDHSKPDYYYQGDFCVLDPLSNLNESNKTCRDGGIPLIGWDGYDVIKIVSLNSIPIHVLLV
ncbi:Vacuolar protein sorting/targeting protein 10 [Thelohanellus kitauei]|uniref:Vacuolar protein sorting/targeting protein 10 n=1 Tax=Thelohanellus kitauei TaxID=669202 RepID=A0A0C2N949_THEKT|nr:Vacuolar protein sorting/targeting protein 10 [Thelohanellus kitauei]